MIKSNKSWFLFVLVGLLAVMAINPAQAARRSWIGIYMQDVTQELAEAFELKSAAGVLVNDVSEDSPAEKAGIKPKDIILAWNGVKVNDSDKLTDLVQASAIGDKVALDIDRNGESIKITVEIGERREPRFYGFGGEGNGNDWSEAWTNHGLAMLDNLRDIGQTGIGVSLQSLTGDLGTYFGVENGEGALITEVMKDSPALKAGLKVGDVIVEINGEQVETPGDVSSELRGKDRGEEVELTIVRDKAKQKVSLEVDDITSYGSTTPNILRNFQNWNGNGAGTYHNWGTPQPQVDQEDFMRKMEEMQQRLDEMRTKLDSLEKKMK